MHEHNAIICTVLFFFFEAQNVAKSWDQALQVSVAAGLFFSIQWVWQVLQLPPCEHDLLRELWNVLVPSLSIPATLDIVFDHLRTLLPWMKETEMMEGITAVRVTETAVRDVRGKKKKKKRNKKHCFSITFITEQKSYYIIETMDNDAPTSNFCIWNVIWRQCFKNRQWNY